MSEKVNNPAQPNETANAQAMESQLRNYITQLQVEKLQLELEMMKLNMSNLIFDKFAKIITSHPDIIATENIKAAKLQFNAYLDSFLNVKSKE